MKSKTARAATACSAVIAACSTSFVRDAHAQSNDPAASSIAPSGAAPTTSTNAPSRSDEGARSAVQAGATTPHDEGSTEPAPDLSVPPANTGFQMAFRLGYSFVQGKSSNANGDDTSSLYSGHFPLIIDVGGKPWKHVFLGAYFDIGIGGAGSALDGPCSGSGVSCSQASLRAGAQIQYHVSPDKRGNLWFGYGIGYESTALGISAPAGSSSVSTAGPEYGRLMVGFDVRVSKGFGVGPYMDSSLGHYTTISAKTVDGVETRRDVGGSALHSWTTFGVRFVVFP